MDRPVSVAPFLDAAALLRELNALQPNPRARTRELSPAADLVETAEGLVLQLDMPGHDPQGIDVKVEGQALTIRSERKPVTVEGKSQAQPNYLLRERAHGVFARTFVLPEGFDASRVEASFHDGVLTLSVPKREEAKPRTIKVNVVNGGSEPKTIEG